MKRLPLNRLRQCLYQLNTSSCVEKLEFQKLLTVRLFFRHVAFPRSSESISLPNWAFNMTEHKLSYFFARRERRRDRILLSELCAIQWSFRFKSMSHTESYNLKFYEDMTMISEFHNGERLHWEVLFIKIYIFHCNCDSNVYCIVLYCIVLFVLRNNCNFYIILFLSFQK